ncbi:MAG: endolytic transglycosylase MltG [Candidatus Levybacteria bacterium]|nr:endolytic transglycosylase MltG [Candidatus Levybacteria bacterium]
MRKPLVVGIILIVIVLGTVLWWNNGMSAVDPKDTTQKSFVIPKGSAVRTIGNDLKEVGLIKDPVVFFLYTKLNKLDRDVQAGSYKLSPSMDLTKIMDTLGHGSVDVWITIPEGYRAAEVAQVLQKNIGTYNSNWVTVLEANEGYLFPDTYLIPRDADVETVVSIMRNTFNSKIQSIGISPVDSDLLRIITIASLIEREALRDDEKVMISSVIANRLNDGMALDIDATLQYIKGKDAQGKWWSVPTSADKALNSPYNTYKNPGIPPGPIANPGLEAIRAAANPAKSGYYFYIHDLKGNVHFAETLMKHNENIANYLN